jgi:hypothetical protein
MDEVTKVETDADKKAREIGERFKTLVDELVNADSAIQIAVFIAVDESEPGALTGVNYVRMHPFIIMQQLGLVQDADMPLDKSIITS